MAFILTVTWADWFDDGAILGFINLGTGDGETGEIGGVIYAN